MRYAINRLHQRRKTDVISTGTVWQAGYIRNFDVYGLKPIVIPEMTSSGRWEGIAPVRHWKNHRIRVIFFVNMLALWLSGKVYISRNGTVEY